MGQQKQHRQNRCSGVFRCSSVPGCSGVPGFSTCPMKDLLGVSPSKGNQGTTRDKEKKIF